MFCMIISYNMIECFRISIYNARTAFFSYLSSFHPKVLLDSCPKCIEERYIQDSNNSDNRSVGSRRSTKSDNRSVSSRHSAQSDNSRNSNKPNHRSSVASSSRFATFSSAAVRSPSAPRSGGSKMKMKSADKTTMARYECPFGKWLLTRTKIIYTSQSALTLSISCLD